MRALSLCLLLLLSVSSLPAGAQPLDVIDLGVIPLPGPITLTPLPEAACEVGELGFEVLPTGFFGRGFLDSGLGPDFVIRNRRQWCEFWRTAHSGLYRSDTGLPPPCDKSLVDFRNELVIATLGGAGTCIAVAVERIEQKPGSRDVTVFVNDIQYVTANGCGCLQFVNYPVQAVVVAEPIGRVEFVHEGKVQELCSAVLTPAD